MSDMDTNLAELSKSIDPAILGRRIRNARVAAGLTQTEAAGGHASTAYISRIEAGHRRPDLKLLGQIAERVGTTLEELLMGITRDKRAELQLELDYAELSLSSGSPVEALERADAVLAALPEAGIRSLERPARYVRAFALEASGDLDGAILQLEPLSTQPPFDLDWIRGLIALSRCYRESGDLSMAIDAGEKATSTIAAQGLEGLTEALQLTLTVAGAYFERGDVAHAVRLCQSTIARAEQLDSPRARGSAYWNASFFSAEQGSVSEALILARKALALFEQDSDTRHLASLRTQMANMQLRLDPPQAEEAIANLQLAARELDWSSASPIDKADNQLSMARANLVLGNIAQAAELSENSYMIFREGAPLYAADALVLKGQIAASQGRTDEATSMYKEAILMLSGAGADRRAAELWFELGGLLQDVGEPAAALDAYRRAAASTGLTQRIPLNEAMMRAKQKTGQRTLRVVPVPVG
jgi:tetratricopeptide (TPR) repeat protein